MSWIRLRESLWFIPAVMTVLAAGLAFATMELDTRLVLRGDVRDLWFVFGVGAEGVRGVLSAIAGSIITVTGVVFSVTIVALQLASTQFTPRVLRTFLEDRANHVVLGTFIGTFTYALVVLRFVRAESSRVPAFVPPVSVAVAMLLALASIGCLIFFIDHSAHSIRASTIIARLVDEASATARHVFPERAPDAREDAPRPGLAALMPLPGDPAESMAGEFPAVVHAAAPGYLQYLDEDALLALPSSGALVVRMEARVGEYLRSGDVLASLRATGDQDADHHAKAVRAACVLGDEPTGPQDIGIGISRLVDIAVRALSPGINDPGTAAMCIDGLSEVLVVVGCRVSAPLVRWNDEGSVCLAARRPTYEECVVLAFAQIRHYGADSPFVAIKLLDMAGKVASRVPPARRAVLAEEARHVHEAAERSIADPADRMRVAAVAASVLGATQAKPRN